MATDLPTEFDVVVLGTGLPESIIAAAFSRNGYKVLHLDRNPYYSSSWASFSLCNLEDWAKSHQGTADTKPDCDFGDLLKENETVVKIPSHAQDISNIKTHYHVRETAPNVLANVVQDVSEDKTSTEPEISRNEENNSISGENKSDFVDGAGDNVTKKTEDESSSERLPAVSDSDIVPSATKIKTENIDNKQDKDSSVQNDDDSSPAVPGGGSVESSVPTDTEASSQEESKVTSPKKEKTMETHQEQHDKKVWTATDIKNEWRKFNLDLAPKVLYSTSQTVDLLISSDVAKYCEFRTVSRVLTLLGGQLEKVPCSRADVFGSRKVSVLEKRMLMKFMTSCAQYEENPEFYKDFKEKPFCDFLKAKKLTPNIHHFVQHSIAMVTDEDSTEEGMKKMKRFLISLGRYGNTAFLFPLYGSGELPQAFCRLCAVFGGTYCLQMSANALVIKEKRCCAVITSDGQRIECKHVILGPTYCPAEYKHTDGSFVSRGILLTDKSILCEDSSELSLLYMIPEKSDGPQKPITVLELPPSSMVCPKDMNVVHLTRQGSCDAESDLASTVTTLFTSEEDESKPSVLWSLYFTQQDFSSIKTTECKPDNVYIVPGPGTDLDMDLAVQEARHIWQMVCHEEEFLPKPPNPEDIIYVDDEETKVGEQGTGSLETEAELAEDITNKCSISNEDQSQTSQSLSPPGEGEDNSSQVSESTNAPTSVEGKDNSSQVSESTNAPTSVEGKDNSSQVSESTNSPSSVEGKDNSSQVSESTNSPTSEEEKDNSSNVKEISNLQNVEKNEDSAT